MAKAYSQDLRDRILSAYDRGKETRQIAQALEVSPAWARRVKQRRRESGSVCAKPMGGVRVVKIDLERLRQLVSQQPDATIKELHQRLACHCSESAVGMALVRLNLTFKKRRSLWPSRTAPTLPSAAPAGNTGRPANRRSG